MINFKKLRNTWLIPSYKPSSVDPRDYKKHFQLAVINLEQNMIEERMPELRKTA